MSVRFAFAAGLLSLLPVAAASAQAAVASPVFAQASARAAVEPNRVAAEVDFTQRQPLAGHVPAWTRMAADQGAVPDTERVQMNFGLSRSAAMQAAFEQMLADQQNPGSPRFHQWLQPAQVGELFGPTQHDVAVFTAWLAGQGFTVESVAPSRMFVQASAPAATVSASFQTSLHRYGLTVGGRAETLQAPTSEPILPAALAPIVSYVGGLASVPLHTYSHYSLDSRPAPESQAAAAGLHPNLTASASTHYLTPLDFNKIYDVTASGLTGTGQKIMIIGGSRLYAQDISNWESLTAQAAYTPNYIVGTGFTDPGVTQDDNMGEGTLDFERAFGTAPGATIDMVIAKNWLDGTTNANLIQYAIGTVNDPVMSLSFGACENLQTPAYVRQEDSMYAVAESQGISVLVSSGDAGVAGCEAHGVAPPASQIASINDICATTHVTCVGGTQFIDTASPSTYWSSTNSTGYLSALSYIPEGAWNEPVNTGSNSASVPYLVAATGGGPSTIIAKPTWQTGTGVPADGARDTPDISFSAAGHDGYFACLNYTGGSCVSSNGSIPFVAFGGTSASAPSMAGVAALIDQKLGVRQGNLNPAFYKLAASSPAAFHDATIATSGVSGCSTATPSVCNNSDASASSLQGGIAGYALQTGYDLATGLGSLDVSAYLSAISAPSVTATTTTLTATPSTITTRKTVIFTATVAAASGTTSPTGTVVFASNGTTLATVSLTSGAASTAALSFTTAGTYAITATYSGDSSYAASTASLSFIVTAPVLPATTTTLTGTTGTITTQQTATYTATVASSTSGTITGTVTFNRVNSSGLSVQIGSAVSLVNGAATLPATVLPAGTYSVTAVYSGDTNYGTSTSNALSVTVNAVAANIVLSNVPATVTSTTAINPVATVTSATGSGTPSGTVQFLVDGKAVGTTVFSLTAGTVNGPAIYLTAGTHVLSAVYAGDTVFQTATSASIGVTSTLSAVGVSLAPVSATIFDTQTVTLTATLSGLSSGVLPAGAVQFYDGSTLLGTGTAAVFTGTTTSGTSTYVAGPLAVGTHTITAVFAGDASYAKATSNVATITVTASTLSVTPAATTLSTAAGTAVTDTLTLAYAGAGTTENLTCSVAYAGTGTVVNAPTCALAPASVSFSGTGSATSTLTLSSTHASVSGTELHARNPDWKLGGVALCGLGCLLIPGVRRRRLRGVLATVLLLGVLGAAVGCGGNNFTSSNPVQATTSGNYTVTVTAAAASGPGAQAKVTLTIQ